MFRLPESLPPESRSRSIGARSLSPLNLSRPIQARQNPELGFLLLFVTFAFSNMEQTFSLLFQTRFSLDTGQARDRTGLVLMFAGILGAVIQGSFICKAVPRFGERRLLIAGLCFNALGMVIFPFGPTLASYFLLILPLACGSGRSIRASPH